MKYVLLIFSIFILSCTRPKLDLNAPSMKINIQLPQVSQKVSSQSFVVPQGKKLCLAVNVTGPGIITEQPIACGPQVGVFSGFAPEGGTLEVDVTTGADRSFQLYAMLIESSETCPSVVGGTLTPTQAGRVYEAGIATGINIAKAIETVNINFSMPELFRDLTTKFPINTCTASEGLKAQLFSNGDIKNSIDLDFNLLGNILSLSYASSLMSHQAEQNLGGHLGIGFSGGEVILCDVCAPITVPPYISSLTRKPDTGEIFGLRSDGLVVRINFLTGEPEENCPFSSCQVPPWIQSISAGRGTSLFGVDAEGRILLLGDSSSDPIATSVVLNPAVAQVVFW